MRVSNAVTVTSPNVQESFEVGRPLSLGRVTYALQEGYKSRAISACYSKLETIRNVLTCSRLSSALALSAPSFVVFGLLIVPDVKDNASDWRSVMQH